MLVLDLYLDETEQTEKSRKEQFFNFLVKEKPEKKAGELKSVVVVAC